MKTQFHGFLSSCILACTFVPTAFAAKETFDRSKPHVNIGTIGHVDHGKTTLTAALSKAAKRPLKTKVIRYEDLEGTGKILMNALVTKIRTYHLQYLVHDFNPDDTVKNMVTGALPQDGAIMVVSAADGPMPQTREHILLARQVGVPVIVVFLNVDGIGEPRMIDLVEEEIRNLLSLYEYDGANAPVIRGSVLGALAGDRDSLRPLAQLMDALDQVVTRPVKPADQPFLMPIEDVFSIGGRGTVATGKIETGRVRMGDEVEIVGWSEETSFVEIAAIQIEGNKEAEKAEAGDNVGLLLRGIEKSDIKRGQVIAQPGTIRAASRFRAQVYVLTKDEGGNRAPFFNGYRPQFYFRTTDVSGGIQLPPRTRMVMPGDSSEIEVELIVPVALNKGLRFAIREGGRTVGAGQVTEILEKRTIIPSRTTRISAVAD